MLSAPCACPAPFGDSVDSAVCMSRPVATLLVEGGVVGGVGVVGVVGGAVLLVGKVLLAKAVLQVLLVALMLGAGIFSGGGECGAGVGVGVDNEHFLLRVHQAGTAPHRRCGRHVAADRQHVGQPRPAQPDHRLLPTVRAEVAWGVCHPCGAPQGGPKQKSPPSPFAWPSPLFLFLFRRSFTPSSLPCPPPLSLLTHRPLSSPSTTGLANRLGCFRPRALAEDVTEHMKPQEACLSRRRRRC